MADQNITNEPSGQDQDDDQASSLLMMQRDQFLIDLVQTATSGNKDGQQVTLVVGGSLISGRVITGFDFFAASTPSEPRAPLAEGSAYLDEMYKEIYLSPLKDSQVAFIHLGNAKIKTGLMTVDARFIRVRISSVDALTMGAPVEPSDERL